MCTCMYIYTHVIMMHTQTQTDRQAGRQTGRQSDRCRYVRIFNDIHIPLHTYIHTHIIGCWSESNSNAVAAPERSCVKVYQGPIQTWSM